MRKSRRKTCECCRVRLGPDEDYWCDECRRSITGHYHHAQKVIAVYMAERGIDKDTPSEVAVAALLDYLNIALGPQRDAQ